MFFTYDRTYWAFTPAPSRKILNEFFIPVQPLSPYAVAKLNNDFIQAGVPAKETKKQWADAKRYVREIWA